MLPCEDAVWLGGQLVMWASSSPWCHRGVIGFLQQTVADSPCGYQTVACLCLEVDMTHMTEELKGQSISFACPSEAGEATLRLNTRSDVLMVLAIVVAW